MEIVVIRVFLDNNRNKDRNELGLLKILFQFVFEDFLLNLPFDRQYDRVAEQQNSQAQLKQLIDIHPYFSILALYFRSVLCRTNTQLLMWKNLL